jgi:hypothetical protein
VNLNPEPFQIQEWERETMKKVHALIPSPRAAKRFVNVYRLLRAQVAHERREAFIGDAAGSPHTGSDSWRLLLDELGEIRDPPGEDARLIPNDQSCVEFRAWAPEVARYSFQSGRVLLLERSPVRATSSVTPAILPRIDAPA